MPTKYELALNEFRDASAEVRRSFNMLSEAREAQILANRGHGAASELYAKATARLDAADQALQAVRPEAPTPADIDVTMKPLAGTVVMLPNGGDRTVHIPDPSEMGMG